MAVGADTKSDLWSLGAQQPDHAVEPKSLLVRIVGRTEVGGMGSVPGALIGGLFVGVVESLSGFVLGESLGQIGIFVMFILMLLFRPSGLFGERE